MVISHLQKNHNRYHNIKGFCVVTAKNKKKVFFYLATNYKLFYVTVIYVSSQWFFNYFFLYLKDLFYVKRVEFWG